MSQRQGHIVNDAEVAGITTSYALAKIIKLHEDTASDARSQKAPSSCMVGDLECVVDVTGGSPTQIDGYLTYDATGDNIMAGEFQETLLVSGLTDTSLRMFTVQLREVRTWPASETQGECYLFLKTDTGTVTLKKARLHWSASR